MHLTIPRLRISVRAVALSLVFSAAFIPPHPALAGQWIPGSYSTSTAPLIYIPFAPLSRDYRLFVPASYQAGTPIPLVVMLHGCKQDPDIFAAGTRMNRLAESENFLVLYPKQDSSSNSDRCWNWYDPSNQNRGAEAAIISGMVEKIKREYSVNKSRIYVAGMSAGGAMTSIMASCYSGMFAAAAVHSGLEYEAAGTPWAAETLLLLQWAGLTDPNIAGRDAYRCSGSRRRLMPVMVIHGDADKRVNVINADQVIKQFAQMNDYGDDGRDDDSIRSIPTSTTSGSVPNGRSYTVEHYNYGGRLLYQKVIVKGMAHAWSGGDNSQDVEHNDPQGPDASGLIWKFFSLHSR